MFLWFPQNDQRDKVNDSIIKYTFTSVKDSFTIFVRFSSRLLDERKLLILQLFMHVPYGEIIEVRNLIFRNIFTKTGQIDLWKFLTKIISDQQA